jgi:hypothetical protein
MPAYNFKAQFAPAVAAGQKLSTIRGRSARVGATAYLFTGMRTKACKRLGQGRITGCEPIALGSTVDGLPTGRLAGELLSQKALNKLAKIDGFPNALAMIDWFAETYDQLDLLNSGSWLVFEGFLTTWELDK